MLFIILSIAVGIFNANSARTLNQNAEDRIYYTNGADVVVQANWPSSQVGADGEGSDGFASVSAKEVYYQEPDFKQFTEMEGVESAARVFIEKEAYVEAPLTRKEANKVHIMGIEPYEFGHTAWFRNDLLKYHINDYLNIMNGAPKAVLVSTSLQEKLALNAGDTIRIRWGGQNTTEFTVYAFIDYWPSYNPYRVSAQAVTEIDFVVGNLDYIQMEMIKEPYEVWIKRADGVTDTDINAALDTLDVTLSSVEYSHQEVITAKNDPLLQGLNGMLTLSFVITMIISVIGFLIYWALSIKSRALQFGIFRAMGMSLMSVLGIIIAEQIMISVVAILIGIILGGITSDLFVPMMQLVYNAAQQVPPFIVVASRDDYIKIYAMIGAMLSIGFVTIARIISRIKIAQALKLGED